MEDGPFFVWANSLSVDSIWVFLKWVYVLVFSLYVAFAVVVLTQIRQMLAALNGQLDNTIRMIGVVHLLVAVGALLVAIVVL
jgi:hypothetical protein